MAGSGLSGPMALDGPVPGCREGDSVVADEASALLRDTVLIDRGGQTFRGDVALYADGSWRPAAGDEDAVDVVADGSGRLVTRATSNWHTHLAMQLNRGAGEGLPLQRWLEENIFVVEGRLDADLVRIGTEAAAAEMTRTGSSLACDMYYHADVVAEVMLDAGLRALVTGPVTDFPTPSYPGGAEDALGQLDALLASGHSAPGQVEYGIGTHAVYTCSDETLLKAADLADRHDARLHIHASETRTEVTQCHERTGAYPVDHLDAIGFLRPGVLLAHCGWVTKGELRKMAAAEAVAVHCPRSNQKLATGGTMPYVEALEAGVEVRLGTDGTASNNSLDVRREATFASLVQRQHRWDPTILPAVESWDLATAHNRDWVTWDRTDIRMRPWGLPAAGEDGFSGPGRLLANLVYSDADSVDMWVAGDALRRDGVSLRVDEAAMGERLESAVARYYDGVDVPSL